jgi:hypothetical protein
VRAVWLPALLLALALTGCESNIERSADLAKLAHHRRALQQGLSIAHVSADVEVVATTVLRGTEAAAAVVQLRNRAPRALRDVPIAIAVKDAGGRTLYQNDTPGLEATLTSLASIAAHGEATWIDDQVQASSAPASASATVGEAPAASGPLPRIEVEGLHPGEESATGGRNVAGTVRNRSGVTQQSLVVYVLAKRGSEIVAAGRAQLAEVAAGASVPFQAFLVGSPSGGRLEASAPPTTLG